MSSSPYRVKNINQSIYFFPPSVSIFPCCQYCQQPVLSKKAEPKNLLSQE